METVSRSWPIGFSTGNSASSASTPKAARWNQWKAVRDPNTKNLELYDLEKDVGESHNVAAEHPHIVAKFNEYFASARSDSLDWPMTMNAEQQAQCPATQRTNEIECVSVVVKVWLRSRGRRCWWQYPFR